MHCQDAHIQTSADVLEWRNQLFEGVKAFGGERVDMIIDINDFSLARSVIEEYGRTAKKIVSEHARSCIRYGAADCDTKAEILLQSVANRYPANIFPDRATAVEAIQRIRAMEAELAAS